MADLEMGEDQILSAFDASQDNPLPNESEEQANPTAEAQVEGQDATEQEADSEPGDQEETQSAAEEDKDTQTIEIDPDEPLFEFEVTKENGGKEPQKLSLKELQQGYMRDADYRRKTQDIAQQRHSIPQEVAKQVQSLRDEYINSLNQLQALAINVVAPELQSRDLNKLAAEQDWEMYHQTMHKQVQIAQLMQSIKQAQDADTAKQKEEKEKRRVEAFGEIEKSLSEAIPNYDSAVHKRLIDTAIEFGFTADDLMAWTDVKRWKMLQALADRKDVSEKTTAVKKKVAVVTKTLKPGQPAKQNTNHDQAMAKLRKTGRREDALDVFERFV